MLSVTLDTSCCIDIYGTQPDADLLGMLNLALRNKVDLAVSDVVTEDLRNATGDKLAIYERRLGIFPKLLVAPVDEADRDARAEAILQTIFPDSPAASASHDNNRRDCRHLATHALKSRDVFVTLDKRLIGKAGKARKAFGITILSPSQAVERLGLTGGPRAPLSVAVRPYRSEDEAYVRRTLADLHKDWLVDRLRASQVAITIGELEGRQASLAISEPREEGCVEVSLLHVEPAAAAADLGGHLLFHLIRSWIGNGFDTARVTVRQDPRMLAILRELGFLVTGVQTRASSPTERELQMVKYLERQVLDEPSYPGFADRLATLLTPLVDSVFGTGDSRPPASEPESLVSDFDARTGEIALKARRSGASRRYLPADLEICFYPLRVVLPSRRGLIIPIKPEWAGPMISYEGRQEQLFQTREEALLIRSDNVYYCYPRCVAEVKSRCPIIFYVSSPISACVGEAKIVQSAWDIPEVLHALFGGIGVYDVEHVRAHVRHGGAEDGRALALRFSHYVPFPSPVRLPDLRKVLGQPAMNPQGLHPISMDAFEELRAKGGRGW
jgi:predicted transcriptional regulator